MSASVRAVEYFYARVPDRPGQAAQVLSLLEESGVGLLAFSIVPSGDETTELVIFPESASQLTGAAKRASMGLKGPHYALLVQGDSQLSTLAELHRKLAHADINVYASSGVTDADGDFGYILYVRGEVFKKAAEVVGANVGGLRTGDIDRKE